jgi:hypothetical protein
LRLEIVFVSEHIAEVNFANNEVLKLQPVRNPRELQQLGGSPQSTPCWLVGGIRLEMAQGPKQVNVWDAND